MPLLRPHVGLISRPYAEAIIPPEPPDVALDYCIVVDTNPNASSYSNDFSVPAPQAGQKFFLLGISEEALSGTPSLGGGTTGVTVRETDSYDDARVFVIELDGWEAGTSLSVALNFVANNTYLAMHGWWTRGLDYVPDSLVSGQQAGSNQTATILALTKSLNDAAFMGTRKYSSITGSPSPTQDFQTSSVWAGHLPPGTAFSGNLTANATVNFTFKRAAAFLTTPSSP